MGVGEVMGGTIMNHWTPGDALEQRILGRPLALVQAGNKETFNSVHESAWVGVSHRQDGGRETIIEPEGDTS